MTKSTQKRKTTTSAGNLPGYILKWLGLSLTKRPWLRKTIIGFIVFIAVLTAGMYGVAQYYINKHSKEPLVIGATFSPYYAQSFGLDPKQTMDAMINDLGFKRLRLVSYWDKSEPTPGQYDFTDLDWQFKKAEQADVKISLALGLRQPRWPECHMPKWAENQSMEQWSPKLNDYITEVVNRYKDSPVLESYQLENEYFLTVFGDCPDHSKERLISEFNLVKSLDSSKPLIVTRSNNAVPSWPIGEPRSDINGASIYKRVWDKTVTQRYFEYPVPAWFYGFLAGGAEITTGRDTFIHELQTEAWLPTNEKGRAYHMNDISSIPEQNKSLSPDQLADRIDYAAATGMRTIDVWGVEWWYWRKEVAKDPTLWDVAKQKVQEANSLNL